MFRNMNIKRYQSTSVPIKSIVQQSPNRLIPWSKSQASRSSVLNHAKFSQRDLTKQPNPPAAIELIAKEPIRFVNDRIAVCQGNKSINQGHPKIYINLDNLETSKTCGYCGLRYQQIDEEKE
ncbi:hypothetical protein WICMUC_005264 [Wickerhamomyces mucosus]|uniref:Zinc finger CHCC-type domain-containing protein n=1 Tax=Wickerhamomyces mucosus TaxID=1378264 RepID=A0A9P8T6W6_9ASCO|nr:hypothetical protein WICMUC_005264 [Wickerhamomyces mucosus]